MAYMNQFSKSNDTTDVTILSAPAASTSRTVPAGGINIANNDSAEIVVTLKLKDDTTDRILEPTITIAVDDSWSNDKNVYTLDATNQILEIVLAGAAATEADVVVMYRDEAQ